MLNRTRDDELYNLLAAELDDFAADLMLIAHSKGGIDASGVKTIRNQHIQLLQLRFNRVRYDTIPIETVMPKEPECVPTIPRGRMQLVKG